MIIKFEQKNKDKYVSYPMIFSEVMCHVKLEGECSIICQPFGEPISNVTHGICIINGVRYKIGSIFSYEYEFGTLASPIKAEFDMRGVISGMPDQIRFVFYNNNKISRDILLENITHCGIEILVP